MPRFPKSTGFKLPGVGGRNVDTPGGFRKDQNAESVGYCSNTEESMLPSGSSPLLAKGQHHDTGWIVPPADTPSYTGSSWPTKKGEKQRIQEQPGEDATGIEPAKKPEIEIVTQEPNPDGGGRLASYEEAWENDLEGIRSNSGEGKGYHNLMTQLKAEGKLSEDTTDPYDAYVYEQTNLGGNETAHRESHRSVAESNPKDQVYGVDNIGVQQDKSQAMLDELQKQCADQGGTYNRTSGACD